MFAWIALTFPIAAVPHRNPLRNLTCCGNLFLRFHTKCITIKSLLIAVRRFQNCLYIIVTCISIRMLHINPDVSTYLSLIQGVPFQTMTVVSFVGCVRFGLGDHSERHLNRAFLRHLSSTSFQGDSSSCEANHLYHLDCLPAPAPPRCHRSRYASHLPAGNDRSADQLQTDLGLPPSSRLSTLPHPGAVRPASWADGRCLRPHRSLPLEHRYSIGGHGSDGAKDTRYLRI